MERTVEFSNRRGVALVGRLYEVAQPMVTAVFSHCFTCSQDLGSVRAICAGLAERGVEVMSFDFTGLGRSGGAFADSTFAAQADDIVDVVRYVTVEVGRAPSILIGHSLGGTASLYASRRLSEIDGVITIGAPSDPQFISQLIGVDAQQMTSDSSVSVCIADRTFHIDKAFVEDFLRHPPVTWLSDIKKSVLLIHSPQDKTVDIKHANNLFANLTHPKSFVALEGADHLISDRTHAAQCTQVMAGWILGRLAISEQRAGDAVDTSTVGAVTSVGTVGDRSASSAVSSTVDGGTKIPTNADIRTDAQRMPSTVPTNGHQVVASIYEQPFITAVNIGDTHTIIADEPSSVGGTDCGATPFQLLLASLGACTVMTIQVYAKRKQLDLRAVHVYLDYTSKPSPLITRQLVVDGNIDEDMRERLLYIADRCPIHKLLLSDVSIDTSYKE